MRVSFAQFSVATAECQSEFVLQLAKVAEFPLHVGQLLLQAAQHRCARLETIPPGVLASLGFR
jgi:hypothetical protein